MGINDLETTAYSLDDFIQCCRDNPKRVNVFYDAELNAREQFGINSKADLLDFIGNHGLEDLTYINTKPFENNQKKGKDILIDAYKFRSNNKLGYIAFMKGVSGQYVIKSFHLDNVKLTLKDIGSNTKKLLR